MKAAISIPDALCKAADAAARELGVSRSRLIRMALEEFLKGRKEDKFRESIDQYIAKYGNELSAEDEAWLEHTRLTVLRELADDDWGPEGRLNGDNDGRGQ